MAETVVVLTALNRQNIEGTRRILDELRNESVREAYGDKRLILVGTPIPAGVSLREQQERLSEIKAEYPGFTRFNLELPYVAELALRELPTNDRYLFRQTC